MSLSTALAPSSGLESRPSPDRPFPGSLQKLGELHPDAEGEGFSRAFYGRGEFPAEWEGKILYFRFLLEPTSGRSREAVHKAVFSL